jgi:hypothetical protein
VDKLFINKLLKKVILNGKPLALRIAQANPSKPPVLASVIAIILLSFTRGPCLSMATMDIRGFAFFRNRNRHVLNGLSQTFTEFHRSL